MKIPEFLEFERKKIILPAVLVALLSLVLIIDTLYYEKTSDDAHEVVQGALEILRLVIYNGSINGMDDSIEGELVNKQPIVSDFQQNAIKKHAPSILLYYGSEYTLNTFGTNFCVDSFVRKDQTECVSTRYGLILPAEVLRLSTCTAYVTSTYSTIFSSNGTYNPETGERLLSEKSVEKNMRIVYSDQMGKTIKEHEFCNYSIDTLLSGKLESSSFRGIDIPFLNEKNIQKIRLLDPIYIALYYMILIAVGYLVSSIVILIHRKNDIIYGKGRKVYAVMILAFLIIVWLFFNLMIIDDIRNKIIVSMIFSYLITTLVWQIYGYKEDKISKKISRARKSGRT